MAIPTAWSADPRQPGSARSLRNQQQPPGRMRGPGEGRSATRGSPEGRYLAGPGRAMYRRVTELLEQEAAANVRREASGTAADRAVDRLEERLAEHRGGMRPWLLRLLVPVACIAEAATAYVGMEVLVPSVALAAGLSGLTAAMGCGLACIVANRRLNRLPVPVVARLLEAAFVVVLTVLRYESMHVQGASPLTAGGAAALAALVSALGLLGIEEIVAETRTCGLFVTGITVSWRRSRHASAVRRHARIMARIETATNRLTKHFLEFLLRVEEVQLEEARRCASAFAIALADREA